MIVQEKPALKASMTKYDRHAHRVHIKHQHFECDRCYHFALHLQHYADTKDPL